MAKTKKQEVPAKKRFFELDDHLFIKLVLVIVISSLFLIAILSIVNKVWQSDSQYAPVTPNVANIIKENKIPDVNSPEPNQPIGDNSDAIACTMEYMPVCAWQANGFCTGPEDCPHKTYGNDCVAGAANANIISEGECP